MNTTVSKHQNEHKKSKLDQFNLSFEINRTFADERKAIRQRVERK